MLLQNTAQRFRKASNKSIKKNEQLYIIYTLRSALASSTQGVNSKLICNIIFFLKQNIPISFFLLFCALKILCEGYVLLFNFFITALHATSSLNKQLHWPLSRQVSN